MDGEDAVIERLDTELQMPEEARRYYDKTNAQKDAAGSYEAIDTEENKCQDSSCNASDG